MFKSLIILLTFLAYCLTLVHSVIPHHHHAPEDVHNAHHHHHANGHDHSHDNGDDDKNAISHIFADAIHHPASEIFAHAPGSKIIPKKAITVDIFLDKLDDLLSHKLKPPDLPPVSQTKHHSSDQDAFFLLRAPPIAQV